MAPAKEITLTIDEQKITVPAGTTIFDAARIHQFECALGRSRIRQRPVFQYINAAAKDGCTVPVDFERREPVCSCLRCAADSWDPTTVRSPR